VATTAELLEWLRQDAPAAKLVAISSAAIYGAGHVGQIAEDARHTPYSPYGYHKLMMEELCRSYADSYGVQVVIARLFSVYGRELKKQLLWDICSKLSRSPDVLELGGCGDELRDWVDVRDVVRILGSLAGYATPDVPTLNVGSGCGVPVREVAQTVIDLWQRKQSGKTKLRFNGVSRSGDPFSLVARNERLKAIGLNPRVELSVGLADYVDWFDAQASTAGASFT
jgi:UDP-glucose 4-epimerase